MTARGLIKVLEQRIERWGDLEVRCTFETIWTDPISAENVYKAVVKDGDRTVTALFIDADNNCYKHEFAVDPAEGNQQGLD